MANETRFRLTFNLPAQKYYFDGNDITGMLVKIEDGNVFFIPSNDTNAEDFVKFQLRGRGGYEAQIDGPFANELLDALSLQATVTEPFFTLDKEKDQDRVSIEHFAGEEPPPKFIPHMRAWFPKVKVSQNGMPDELENMLGDFVKVIRVARDMVKEFDQKRRAGRPPLEIVESRRVLRAFEDLVWEMFPDLHSNGISVEPVQQAAGLLTSFLDQYPDELHRRHRSEGNGGGSGGQNPPTESDGGGDDDVVVMEDNTGVPVDSDEEIVDESDESPDDEGDDENETDESVHDDQNMASPVTSAIVLEKKKRRVFAAQAILKRRTYHLDNASRRH